MKPPYVYLKICENLKKIDDNLVVNREELKQEITRLRLTTIEVPIFMAEMEKLGLIKKVNKRKIKLI